MSTQPAAQTPTPTEAEQRFPIEPGSAPGRLACTLCSSEFPASERAAHVASAFHQRVAAKETEREAAIKLASVVMWNGFVTPASQISDVADAAGLDHAIVQLDVAPIGFGSCRQLNVAACGVRFAVAGGPVPMRPEQIARRLEAGTICRECLRNTIGEIAEQPPEPVPGIEDYDCGGRQCGMCPRCQRPEVAS